MVTALKKLKQNANNNEILGMDDAQWQGPKSLLDGRPGKGFKETYRMTRCRPVTGQRWELLVRETPGTKRMAETKASSARHLSERTISHVRSRSRGA